MKILAIAGAALLALLFRPKPKTAWTNAGLPAPVATLEALEAHAQELANALRTGAPAAGLIRQLQREAGLVAVRDASGIATASGVMDPQTRQAMGYYGRMWKEETP